MDDDVETEPTLLDHAERQTRAMERLLLLHQVLAFVGVVALIVLGIALLGN